MTPIADSKLKMLFVDDRSKRIHAALRKYGDKYEVTIAPNVPEALRLLSGQEWDVVSLDFDLDGNDFGDPESKTCGMEIVRYLEKTPWPKKKRLPEFILHSSNSFGAELMYWRMTERFKNTNHLMITKERFVYE